MNQQELDRLRDLVKMEQESKDLVKLPYRSYRELVNGLISGVKFGGALENAVASTYLGMVKDLVVSLLRVRILKILDQASAGNLPRRNLLLEEAKLTSALEDLENLLKPRRGKAPGRVMIAVFTANYFSIKTSRGNMINDPMVGDLVVLPREDAVELASNFKVARAYRVKARRRPS